jgi:DNA-binding NtrC family response regulator
MRAGCETILLVEDDDGLRELALRILGKQGYHVLSASRSSEAEQLCREHEGQIDIVVTDVVMPGLGGRELVTKLLPIQPQMAVLFMSGYTDQVVFKEGVEKGNTHFIQKPFTPASLSKKVREVLDRESRAD